MKKYVCIHGHFYQPPRENAWLEQIELQDTAYPFHDWNERITYECYTPNTASRILDESKVIKDIVNNYTNINFNYGATLLSWLKEKAPETYSEIIRADKESQDLFGGHGSAIAQAYNHLILPLANKRDITTQILWGLADFEFRFNRPSEGMWLPETAVDIRTLEALAENDIKFTVLAPRQAKKICRLDSDDWVDVPDEKIDPRRAYVCNLPSGNSIAIFFYDGAISKDVAFNKLLNACNVSLYIVINESLVISVEIYPIRLCCPRYKATKLKCFSEKVVLDLILIRPNEIRCNPASLLSKNSLSVE